MPKGWPARRDGVGFSRFAPYTFGAPVARLGLAVRFHDLRHGHVSHCLAGRMNPRKIATRVGRASAKMTPDVYAHTLPDMETRPPPASTRSCEEFSLAIWALVLILRTSGTRYKPSHL